MSDNLKSIQAFAKHPLYEGAFVKHFFASEDNDREAVSTSTPLGEEGDTTLLDLVADDSLPDEDESLLRDDVAREVRAAIDRLEPKASEVARCYYLEGVQLTALARQMEVSIARAGQIRSSAIRHLRKDNRLRALVDDACCWRYKGATAFNRDWTSVTEAAALWRMWAGMGGYRIPALFS